MIVVPPLTPLAYFTLHIFSQSSIISSFFSFKETAKSHALLNLQFGECDEIFFCFVFSFSYFFFVEVMKVGLLIEYDLS